jgi:CHRD domain
MKRLLIVLCVVAVGGAAFGTAGARTDKKSPKRAICHRTASTKKPYVKVRVSAAQLRAHLRHAADIFPAPATCPRTLLTPTSGGTAFRIAMTGDTESPAGDPVGTGTATVRLRAGQGQVCFSFDVQNISLPAVGAHIHRGAAGASGPIVVGLVAPGSSGASRGCVAASRATVAAILASPAQFYVNVHTTDFQAGAIRGQLTGTSDADFGRVFTVRLTGAAEGTTGDNDGTGTAAVRIIRAKGDVCFKLTVQNIILPSVGAHIHRAPAASNGPIVVQFVAPGASGTSSGCTHGVATTLIDEILANPANFYVNVHTTDHPGGAVRAQLA